MTTSTAPISLSTTTIPKSYLQFCEEELNPDLHASYSRKSTLWKVAAVATLVAFTALMVGVLVASALYAPVFFPMIGVCCILPLGQVQKVYRLFEKWSDEASERAVQLGAINKHYQELSGSTPSQLQQLLQQKGINHVTGMQHNDPNLTSLKPLIARHLFWEGHVEELNKKMQEKLELASKLYNKDYTENKDEIYELRSEALEIEKQVLESKAKNAFINAVIRRPHYTGNLEDLGTFSPLSGQERAIGMQAGAAGSNEFFSFKARSMPAIFYDEAKRLAVPDLAMRMVIAMSP